MRAAIDGDVVTLTHQWLLSGALRECGDEWAARLLAGVTLPDRVSQDLLHGPQVGNPGADIRQMDRRQLTDLGAGITAGCGQPEQRAHLVKRHCQVNRRWRLSGRWATLTA